MLACLRGCIEPPSAESEQNIAFDLTLDLVRRVQIKNGKPIHTYVSPSFGKVLGYMPGELLGSVEALSEAGKLIPRSMIPKLNAAAQKIVSGEMKNGFMVEYQFLHAEGHLVWFEHRICFDVANRPGELIIISRDISERRERERLEQALHQENVNARVRDAKVRAEAYRVINHTSKRSLANMVMMIDLLRQRLDETNYQDDEARVAAGFDIRSMLASSKSESIAGINLCRSGLVHANVSAGLYTPSLETLTLSQLLDQLGWYDHPRFVVDADDAAEIRSDVSALQAVLFNAGMNALQHGAGADHGKVHVTARLLEEGLEEGGGGGGGMEGEAGESAGTMSAAEGGDGVAAGGAEEGAEEAAAGTPAADAASASASTSAPPPSSTSRCRIDIRNRGGHNHRALLAAVGEGADLLAHAHAHPSELGALGGSGSTFCGLRDIRLLVQRVFARGTSVELRCYPEEVVFRLTCPVELCGTDGHGGAPSPVSSSSSSAAQSVGAAAAGASARKDTGGALVSSVRLEAAAARVDGGGSAAAHDDNGTVVSGSTSSIASSAGVRAESVTPAADGAAVVAAAAPAPEESPPSILADVHTLPPPGLPAGLIWLCADDDAIARLVAQVTLEKARADETRSRVLGESYDELATLVEGVAALAKEVGPHRLVLCLDQNMDYDQGTFLGTELCTELRSKHAYAGVIIILSANDEPADAEKYVAAGADNSLGKCAGLTSRGISMPEHLIEVVAQAHAARFGGSAGEWTNAKRLMSHSRSPAASPRVRRRGGKSSATSDAGAS